MSAVEQHASDVTLSTMGVKGAILVTDTTAITGAFRAIVMLTDVVFSNLASNITKNDATTASAAVDFGTIAQGTVLYGKFTEVTLTSGTALLYV